MQYDADAESDAASPDRSFVCTRNRVIGQVKAQRKANKAMRNRLRCIEGCKKYESATLKSLEKDLGALKDEGQDLEMKMGMAQVEALIRIRVLGKQMEGLGTSFPCSWRVLVSIGRISLRSHRELFNQESIGSVVG